MRLGDLDALKKAYFDAIEKSSIGEVSIIGLIDNTPTVSNDYPFYQEAYQSGYEECQKRLQGEWLRKEDVIHSIAKQYSEHNELVPIWLSIADMRGQSEQRPQGEWIDKHITSCGQILRWRADVLEQKCNICGRYSLKWVETIPSNYCSHCGAQM